MNQEHSNEYYNEYINWKTKYLQLKSILDIEIQQAGSKSGKSSKSSKSSTFNFYLTHGASTLSNLLSIIKDGKIKLGKDVAKSNRMLSKGKANKNIFANIYFDDYVKSMDNYIDYTIILSPKILEDFDIKFNKSWTDDPKSSYLFTFNKLDSTKIRTDKISNAKNFILQSIRSKPNLQAHELVFDEPIDISKYIIGVTCLNCNEKNADRYIKIKKMLKRNNRSHVKIITNSVPVPYSFFI
jgi:hypothetical protein